MPDTDFSYTVATEPLTHLRALLADGHILPAWKQPRRWSVYTRIQLAISIERRWSIGNIVIWSPTGYRHGRHYLLDGHQRLEAPDPGFDPPERLLRDLTVAEPTYLAASAATAGRSYLPVDAIWHTIPFLHVARTLDDDTVRRAEDIANTFLKTRVVTYRLHGGSPADIYAICSELVRGTFPIGIIDTIAAHARAAEDRPLRP